jgi:hypothetical protein
MHVFSTPQMYGDERLASIIKFMAHSVVSLPHLRVAVEIHNCVPVRIDLVSHAIEEN